MTFLCFETLATVLFQLIAFVCDPIDMASKLLEHYPSLATALDMRGESPMLATACMSFAYFGSNGSTTVSRPKWANALFSEIKHSCALILKLNREMPLFCNSIILKSS